MTPATLTPTRPRVASPALALVALAAAQLMIVLDGTIVTVAIPSIQSALGMAEATTNWVLASYALAFGGLLLAAGRAGDLFGHRRVFRIGLVLFGLASLLGGFATSGPELIAARIAQGAGAAIVAPAALSLLTATFPAGPARDRAVGVYGAMGGLGSVIGLLLGGVLTEYLDWRWILFVNVPIAAAVLAGSAVLVGGERHGGRVDWPGAATVVSGSGFLVYAINRAGSHGWTDRQTVVFGGAAVLLLLAFAVIQRRSRAPMLPPRVLADPGRVGAYLVAFLAGGAMLATFYFLTIHMQADKGFSPMVTGVAFLPFAVGIGVAAGWLGPRWLARASQRSVTVAGLAIAAVAMVWFSQMSAGTNPWLVLLPAQLVAGIGLGLVIVTTTIAGVAGVTTADSGVAAGLVNTATQIGGAIGLAVLVAVATAAGTTAAGFVAAAVLYLVAVLVAGLLPGRGRPAAG